MGMVLWIAFIHPLITVRMTPGPLLLTPHRHHALGRWNVLDLLLTFAPVDIGLDENSRSLMERSSGKAPSLGDLDGACDQPGIPTCQ